MEIMETRVCRKCEIEKPIGSFRKVYGRSASLREHSCGMCRKRAYLARHPEKVQEQDRRRRARAKGISVEEYLTSRWSDRKESSDPKYLAHKNRLRIDGLIIRKNQTRRCPILSAYPKIEYQLNRDYYLRKSKEWGQRNPDANVLTLDQWNEIKRRFQYRCAYCGMGNKKLTRDHVTPLIAGGDDSVMNIVPACGSCNARKHTGPPPRVVQTALFA